jgi:hypothetical protein
MTVVMMVMIVIMMVVVIVGMMPFDIAITASANRAHH